MRTTFHLHVYFYILTDFSLTLLQLDLQSFIEQLFNIILLLLHFDWFLNLYLLVLLLLDFDWFFNYHYYYQTDWFLKYFFVLI